VGSQFPVSAHLSYPAEFWRDFGPTLERAYVRTLDAEAAKQLLADTFREGRDQRGYVIARLEELVSEDPNNLSVVRELQSEFMNFDESRLAPAQKPAIDSVVRQLTFLLPDQEQMEVVPPLLAHRRKARHTIASAIVSRHPLLATPAIRQELLQGYARWDDPELLTPLSRLPFDLSDVADLLVDGLARLKDRNGTERPLREQARVFENLIQTDFDRARALAQGYPTAFVYGAGRARCLQALPDVLLILQESLTEHKQIWKDKTDAIPGSGQFARWMTLHFEQERANDQRLKLCLWALGRFGARDELSTLTHKYKDADQ
jgi:hypothetical protein